MASPPKPDYLQAADARHWFDLTSSELKSIRDRFPDDVRVGGRSTLYNRERLELHATTRPAITHVNLLTGVRYVEQLTGTQTTTKEVRGLLQEIGVEAFQRISLAELTNIAAPQMLYDGECYRVASRAFVTVHGVHARCSCNGQSLKRWREVVSPLGRPVTAKQVRLPVHHGQGKYAAHRRHKRLWLYALSDIERIANIQKETSSLRAACEGALDLGSVPNNEWLRRQEVQRSFGWSAGAQAKYIKSCPMLDGKPIRAQRQPRRNKRGYLYTTTVLCRADCEKAYRIETDHQWVPLSELAAELGYAVTVMLAWKRSCPYLGHPLTISKRYGRDRQGNWHYMWHVPHAQCDVLRRRISDIHPSLFAEDDLLTVSEAAALLGVDTYYVRNRIKRCDPRLGKQLAKHFRVRFIADGRRRTLVHVARHEILALVNGHTEPDEQIAPTPNGNGQPPAGQGESTTAEAPPDPPPEAEETNGHTCPETAAPPAGREPVREAERQRQQRESRVFPKGVPTDRYFTEFIYHLDSHRSSDKADTELAREYTGEPAGKGQWPKAYKLLSRYRKARLEGIVGI